MSPDATAHLIRHLVKYMEPEDRNHFLKKHGDYYGKLKLDANGWHLGDVRVPTKILLCLKNLKTTN